MDEMSSTWASLVWAVTEDGIALSEALLKEADGDLKRAIKIGHWLADYVIIMVDLEDYFILTDVVAQLSKKLESEGT